MEKLVDEAADFELQLENLERAAQGRDRREAQILRMEFNAFLEVLLSPTQSMNELLTAYSYFVTRAGALGARRAEELAAGPAPLSVEAADLMQYAAEPGRLPANQAIPILNSRSHIKDVYFDGDLLKKFLKFEATQQVRFLRAIFTGIVGPVGESGIKILALISKNLIEVKTRGRGARLIGCLDGGHLRVLRYIPDHVHTAQFMRKYKSLCD